MAQGGSVPKPEAPGLPPSGIPLTRDDSAMTGRTRKSSSVSTNSTGSLEHTGNTPEIPQGDTPNSLTKAMNNDLLRRIVARIRERRIETAAARAATAGTKANEEDPDFAGFYFARPPSPEAGASEAMPPAGTDTGSPRTFATVLATADASAAAAPATATRGIS